MTFILRVRRVIGVPLTMKLYWLWMLVLCGCRADQELPEELSFLTDDVLQEIKKRLSDLTDYQHPQSYPGSDSDSRTASNSLLPGVQDQQGKTVSDPGSGCYYKVTESRIIRTHDSINNGATYIDSPTDLQNKTQCRNECCRHSECDLAVFKDKGDEHACYLFACGGACLFTNHTGFSSMIKYRKAEQHEVDLEMLATEPPSTTPSTTTTAKSTTTAPITTTTTTVAMPVSTDKHELASLYGSCTRDENCAGAGMECVSGFCVCTHGFHAQEGVCREECSRFQFECTNEGKPRAYPQCIAVYDTCDGISHCQDSSDELKCDSKQDEKLDELAKLIEQVFGHDEVTGTNSKPSGQGSVNSGTGRGQRPQVAAGGVGSQQTALGPHTAQTSLGNGHRPELRPNVNNLDVHPPGGKQLSPHPVSPPRAPQQQQLPNNIQQQQQQQQNNLQPQLRSTSVPPTREAYHSALPTTAPTKLPLPPAPKETKTMPSKEKPLATSASVASPTAVSSTGIPAGKRKPAISGGVVAGAHIGAEHVSLEEAEAAHITSVSNRTAVVVLAMGLAVTALLLIFVGCRLRMVKRRLRRGRPLNSNEADYLINGMYL